MMFSFEQLMGVEIIFNFLELVFNFDKFDDLFNWFECYGLEGQGGLEEIIYEKLWFRILKQGEMLYRLECYFFVYIQK